MSILPGDLRVYAAATAAEDDTTTQVGGAIDTTKKHNFLSFTGLYQVVSSSPADTTQTVTLTQRNSDGDVVAESPLTLTGLTAVAAATGIRRPLKAVKSATCAGDVALESSTALATGTAQGPGASTNTLQLDTAASTTDDAYNGAVVRLTSGPGAGEIAVILDYVGSTRTATVSKTWSTPPTSSTVYRVSAGMVFEKSPSEIMTVARLFIGATAEDIEGASVSFYQRVYYKHTDASGSGLPLVDATIAETTDGAEAVSGDITFDVDTALNTSSDNGAGNNRQVAPTGYTFNDTTKAAPGTGNIPAGSYWGVWLKLTVPAGLADLNTIYVPTLAAETE